MKTALELIEEIVVWPPNANHIASTRRVSGTLLVDIENTMKEYAKQCCEDMRDRIVQGSFLTEKNWVRNVEIILP